MPLLRRASTGARRSAALPPATPRPTPLKGLLPLLPISPTRFITQYCRYAIPFSADNAYALFSSEVAFPADSSYRENMPILSRLF